MREDSNLPYTDPRTDWGRRGRDRSEVEKMIFRGVLVQPKLRVSEQDRFATMSELFLDLTFFFLLQSFWLSPWTVEGQFMVALYFVFAWNAWVGVAFFNTRFDTDDALTRGIAVVNMLSVITMSVAATWPADGDDGGFTLYVSSYMLLRVLLVVQYFRAFVALPGGRPLTGRFIIGFSCGVCCWALLVALGSRWHNASGWYRWVLVACGLAFDYGTPFRLLPWMVRIHDSHMFERFGGFIVILLSGALFNFVQTMGSPDGAIVSYFTCGTLGILFVFLFILLYSSLPGPDTQCFEESTWNKFRVYAYLYLHMPLGITITLCSISLGHVHCFGPLADSTRLDPSILVFSLTCGVTMMFYGVLHLLSANSNPLLAAVRFVCGALVCEVYAVFDTMHYLSVLTFVVGVLLFQLILEYSVWCLPE